MEDIDFFTKLLFPEIRKNAKFLQSWLWPSFTAGNADKDHG